MLLLPKGAGPATAAHVLAFTGGGYVLPWQPAWAI